MSEGLGFIKKYGGKRIRLADHVTVYPVCDCGGRMFRNSAGAYRCPDCGELTEDEQLRGRTWVTANGTIVIKGTR